MGDDVRDEADREWMARAVSLAASVRTETAPNPWVGAILVPAEGERVSCGATQPPGGRHAEIVALDDAAARARGATMYVTLEPCAHHGRTPPCADALVAAGVRRVVVGIEDPDPRVSGAGVARLRAAGVEVAVGTLATEIERQLMPYLAHRRTGRPWVVLKLAASLDGRLAAADGSSQWITGPEARRDTHQLRAESGAILVGAGTQRRDDPSLTVRDVTGHDPRRIVLGPIEPGARVLPARSYSGPLVPLLDELGSEGVLQLLVEGGARTAYRFHHEQLVDQYVIYLSPSFFGGSDAVPMFAGAGAASIGEIWRGRFAQVRRLGGDLRLDVLAASRTDALA